MKVEILTVCDFATADAGGKLNILGSFDHFWSRTVPMKWPMCCLAGKLRFEKGEEGQKQLTLCFIDADGKSVTPTLNAPINVQVPPHESSAIVQFAMIIQQLNLPHFGEYALGLSIDGRQEASIPLFVREAPLIPPFLPPPPSPA
jgi:hypothetical protein